MYKGGGAGGNGLWEIHLLIHALLVIVLGTSYLSSEAIHTSQGVSSPGQHLHMTHLE